MAANGPALRKRAQKAHTRLDLMRAVLEEAYALGCPDREGFSGDSPGKHNWRDVYDSSYADALERLANDLMMGMCPPGGDWFGIVAGDAVKPEDEADVVLKTRNIVRTIRKEIELSNFYGVAHPTFMDLVFGTGCFLADPNPNGGILHTNFPCHQVGLEPGPNGTVGGVFRKYNILNRNLPGEFPGATFPADITEAINGKPDETTEVDSCFYDENGWKQCVLIKEAVIFERTFEEQPVFVPRWMVMSGEVYGRGPALKMRPEAWTLNEERKLMLMGANMAILGMWSVEENGLINPHTQKLMPGGMVAVMSNAREAPSIAPLETPGNFNFAQFAIEDSRSAIKRGLFVDDLANVEGPKATATEILERQNMVARDRGAAYGRIQSEWLRPYLLRVAGILRRQRKIPDVKIDGRVLDLKFVSPLARVADMEEISKIQQWLSDLGAIAEIDPGVRFIPDTYKAVQLLAERRGLPGDLVRDRQVALDDAAKAMEAEAAANAAAMGAK